MIPREIKPKVRSVLRYARQEISDDAKLMRILIYACDQFDGGGDGRALCDALLKELAKQSEAEPLPDPVDTPPVSYTFDFDGIENWYGKSRGTWRETVKISNARVEGGQIVWDEAKGQREARGWNVATKGKACNGETNLIIPSIKAAGCFDFLGVGQTRKTTGNLFPNSKGEPGMFAPWAPKKGDRVGFYICTLNRHGVSEDPKHERSNVVWITWP